MEIAATGPGYEIARPEVKCARHGLRLDVLADLYYYVLAMTTRRWVCPEIWQRGS